MANKTKKNNRLTDEQRDYLNSLVCQRLSDDEANRALAKEFKNAVNPGIAGELKKGWNADKKDKLAFYIVSDPKVKVPLFFFSLKCGEVHVPYSQERKQEILKNSGELYAAATGHKAEEWAEKSIKDRLNSGEKLDDIQKELAERYSQNMAKCMYYQEELLLEGNNIHRTQETHAAVELVHFCGYDNRNDFWFPLTGNPAKKKWKQMGMSDQTIGNAVFWFFIVPIIREVRNLVGCEYIYLFAADQNKYGSLVSYYEKLGFELREDLGVSKPAYDFSCRFMCQKVTSLRNRRNAFIREYNFSEDKFEL